MSEETKLNVYQKLQKVRKELLDAALKKTGKAKGKNGELRYEYFELKDILPDITKLCDKYNLFPKFNFGLENAELLIIDSDKPEDVIPFPMPTKVSPLIMCNEMQNIGGAKTFAKRYLYFDAFEIAENDETEVKSTEPGALEKINSVQLKVIKQLIEETGTDEVQFMTWAKVDDLKDMTVSKLPSAMKLLNQKKEKQEKEKLVNN
jgi:hypothetical protein